MNAGFIVVAWVLLLYTGALIFNAIHDDYVIPPSLEQLIATSAPIIVSAVSWKTLRIARKTGKK